MRLPPLTLCRESVIQTTSYLSRFSMILESISPGSVEPSDSQLTRTTIGADATLHAAAVSSQVRMTSTLLL